MTYDVAVVGAGIVGAACAAEFARAGLSVIVIEHSTPGAGATGAAMGHIVIMDDSEAQFLLTRFGRDLWRDLANELPAAAQYAYPGTLWIAADQEEMDELRRKQAFYLNRGVRVASLDADELRVAEPELRDGLAGALLMPEDAVLQPPAATAYLLEHACIHLQSGRAMRIEESRVELAEGSPVSAGTIVNAAGIHAAGLIPEFVMPIEPRKGHLLITNRYPGFLRHQCVELGYLKSAHATTTDSVAFNVQPRAGGQVLIGSSRQYGALDSAIDPQVICAILERAALYMPGIAKLSIDRSWTGFRAATPDKLPLIGLCPGYRSVFLAAGHEGLGITTSLATGRLLADQVLGRKSTIASEPYLPERLLAFHA